MWGIVPAAGAGSRIQPLAFSKGLLPVGSRVAPGPVWTPLNPSDAPADKVATFGQQTPGQPDEIAPAYVYLASEADSSFVTGEVFTLLGGGTTAG